MVWMFSDGRVITSVGGGYYTRLTLIERRLSAEGVQRVRSMAVNLLTDAPQTRRPAPNASLLDRPEIFYQGRNHWISDYATLSDQLFDLSWLPDSAWLRPGPQDLPAGLVGRVLPRSGVPGEPTAIARPTPGRRRSRPPGQGNHQPAFLVGRRPRYA